MWQNYVSHEAKIFTIWPFMGRVSKPSEAPSLKGGQAHQSQQEAETSLES